MNTDQHTPSEDELYEQIAKRRYEYDYTSPWEHLEPTPRRLLTQAARNTMEPIIARVRRESMNMFIDWVGSLSEDHPRYSEINGMVVLMAKRFRDDNFPKS